MSQTSYSINQDAGLEGNLYDISFGNDVWSAIAEGDVYVGKVVSLGTDPDQVRAPSASGDITSVKAIRGVALRTNALEATTAASGTIEDESEVNVLREGRVWVQVEDAVTPASDVYVRYSGTGTKGAFRSDDPGSEAAAFPGNAKFLSSADAGGLAILEFDLK